MIKQSQTLLCWANENTSFNEARNWQVVIKPKHTKRWIALSTLSKDNTTNENDTLS